MKKIMTVLFSAIFAAGIFAGCSGGTKNDADNTTDNGMGQTENTQGMMSASYADMMKTGKYLMHYKTTVTSENQNVTSDVTQAIDGANMSMTTNTGEMAIRMIKKDKTVYVLNDEAKTYYKIAMGDTNASGTTASIDDQVIDTTGITYAGKGRAELNGKEMDYEEYLTDQGTVRYYFDGGKLYAIVFKSADMESVMEIIELSDKVTADMFEIPKGYTESTTY
ncbi:MAG TPA: hypothetical protein VLR72_06760 [Clostridiaceae bacterium]|nr:hypothetical protein [Clostridiaceae bacterium]